jgi:hypothetical protein
MDSENLCKIFFSTLILIQLNPLLKLIDINFMPLNQCKISIPVQFQLDLYSFLVFLIGNISHSVFLVLSKIKSSFLFFSGGYNNNLVIEKRNFLIIKVKLGYDHYLLLSFRM